MASDGLNLETLKRLVLHLNLHREFFAQFAAKKERPELHGIPKLHNVGIEIQRTWDLKTT